MNRIEHRNRARERETLPAHSGVTRGGDIGSSSHESRETEEENVVSTDCVTSSPIDSCLAVGAAAGSKNSFFLAGKENLDQPTLDGVSS